MYNLLTRRLYSMADVSIDRAVMYCLSRRQVVAASLAGAGLALPGVARAQGTPVTTSPPAGEIMAVARQFMDQADLRAVIVRVLQAGEEIAMGAIGESLTGVPATTDMHFRNGAVAISLIATLLLVEVDRGVVALDDTIERWMPDLPESDAVTFRMLANMTAGYRDYVQNPDLIADLYEDPFQDFDFDELVGYSLAQPRLFAPGTNWEYSHTAYVILGRVLEEITGEPLDVLMDRRVLQPLGLEHTQNAYTAEIPEPVLHAYSSERRSPLGIEPGNRFYEESTYWHPGWTIAKGAIQTTTIADMAASMEAVGKGTLLTPETYAAMVDRALVGFGEPLEGCASCRTHTTDFVYGLGVWMAGPWLMQNPLFYGYSGTAGHHPEGDITIAVAVTYGEGSFDPETGDYAYDNVSTPIFQAIGELFTG